MQSDPFPSSSADHPLLTLPRFAQHAGPLTTEAIAFRAGAALAMLGAVLGPGQGVPQHLLANRLALRAAASSLRIEGRSTSEADIRDAFHLTRAGDEMGPDGATLAFWRQAANLKPNARSIGPAQIGGSFSDAPIDPREVLQLGGEHADSGGPLAGCLAVIRSTLEKDPTAEKEACRLSDLLLARHVAWPLSFPVSILFLTKPLLRDCVQSPEAGLKLQARILDGIVEVHRLARVLCRRATAVQTVARKLRAKTSDAALEVFLREEAVLPSAMLAPRIAGTKIAMTDRAARRFCDRLVSLDVAVELTGRPSFRLYSIAP